MPEEKNVKDVFDNQHKIGYLGVQGGSIIYKDIGVIVSLGEGFVYVWQFTNQMMVGVYRLITGHHSSDEIGSVLRIADMSGKVTQIGYAATLWFIGVLSINLGLINLLPIPVLDGGHLLFYLIEAITGRPVGMKIYNLANKIGLFVILALSVLAISNDILFFLSK